MEQLQQHNQHLLWRAAFGPHIAEFDQVRKARPGQYFEALLKASAKKPVYLNVAGNAFNGLAKGIDEIGRQQRMELTDEQKKALRQQSREDLKNLNLYWLDEMVNSDAQLREKMAFFWHGHFACRNLNIFYQQLLLHEIRTHALGNFGELLRAVSKSAAMINFLNNNQNRKDHPNENFAREVMELFTMGRGHYTEEDVKEAARAFTGWGANLNGDFVFRKFVHDAGSKTFLGRTGNFDGDDIISMLLEQPQTARFITRKLYAFFVNDVVDEQRVDQLAASFYQSGYDIPSLLRAIFTSTWFYEDKNIGARIKSPVELWVGIRRTFPLQLQDNAVQLLLQRLMGQLLFYPPSVAGWPGGRSWIDSSSLLLRMRLPQLVAGQDVLSMQPKDDDDQMMGRRQAGAGLGIANGKGLQATVDWPAFLKRFSSYKEKEAYDQLAAWLLQSRQYPDHALVNQYIHPSDKESMIIQAAIRLMSCPEYQLC
ncbi:DUF1800 domain-containing protein [Flavihumibacter rivuli]|uniref:DUF1800 domain-containing protein n=1 Tax=Flavihumibacter rivuli TaxID=2838156 RepID=UPI001BDF2DED|nr:DUF1800 domain-containing protein [Flavihumibacter rivuli]ULQ55085.1 DUF1800 domain-containing protein [Flavihumibacter rivuli]